MPFTWLLGEAKQIASVWNGDVLIGGPGLMKPTECEGFEPIVFHNPCATFTTRGCPRKCEFCAVPILEGKFKELSNFRPAPVICDNNLLAATKKHIRRVVDRLKIFPQIDFNQGLDANLFTPEIADMLGELRCRIRFAFDSWAMESAVKDAIELCRRHTTKNIGVYCLIGFNDNPEDARARLELIRSWGIRPNPMRYQPLNTIMKNSYVALGWTERKLRDITRYYSRLAWLEHIPFEDYQHVKGIQGDQQIEI